MDWHDMRDLFLPSCSASCPAIFAVVINHRWLEFQENQLPRQSPVAHGVKCHVSR
jgi:hypothetical protein